MPAETNWVKIRPLGGTHFREGIEAGWTGKVLEIRFAGGPAEPAFRPGALVEVGAGSRFLLGVVQDHHEAGVSVLVEHSLEDSEVRWISDVWG